MVLSSAPLRRQLYACGSPSVVFGDGARGVAALLPNLDLAVDRLRDVRDRLPRGSRKSPSMGCPRSTCMSPPSIDTRVPAKCVGSPGSSSVRRCRNGRARSSACLEHRAGRDRTARAMSGRAGAWKAPAGGARRCCASQHQTTAAIQCSPPLRTPGFQLVRTRNGLGRPFRAKHPSSDQNGSCPTANCRGLSASIPSLVRGRMSRDTVPQGYRRLAAALPAIIRV